MLQKIPAQPKVIDVTEEHLWEIKEGIFAICEDVEKEKKTH